MSEDDISFIVNALNGEYGLDVLFRDYSNSSGLQYLTLSFDSQSLNELLKKHDFYKKLNIYGKAIAELVKDNTELEAVVELTNKAKLDSSIINGKVEFIKSLVEIVQQEKAFKAKNLVVEILELNKGMLHVKDEEYLISLIITYPNLFSGMTNSSKIELLSRTDNLIIIDRVITDLNLNLKGIRLSNEEILKLSTSRVPRVFQFAIAYALQNTK
jgi:hypothetical protein